MAVIVNPNYKPATECRLALEANLKASMEKTGETLNRIERMKISEKIAEDAVMSLLKPIAGRFIDANKLKVNQPGYDFLIDDSLRVQVKGNSFVECVQWTHKGNDPSLACLAYDVIVIVDIGVAIKKDFGRLAKYNIETKDTVDFYIIPRDEVLNHLTTCRENKMGKVIYWYKRELNQEHKEYKMQYFNLPKYKNNFAILNDLL